MSDEFSPEFLDALLRSAADYRDKLRLDSSQIITVMLPHHLAEQARQRYGTLAEASVQVFGPNIELRDAYWDRFCLDVVESVNARLVLLADAGYFSRSTS